MYVCFLSIFIARHIVFADCHCAKLFQIFDVSERMRTLVNYLPLNLYFQKLCTHTYIHAPSHWQSLGYNHELLCSRCHCKIIEFKLGTHQQFPYLLKLPRRKSSLFISVHNFCFSASSFFSSTNLLSPTKLAIANVTSPTHMISVLGPASSWLSEVFFFA
jgi:hypothetical protein